MAGTGIKKVLVTDNVSPCCKEILEKGGLSVDQKDKLSKEELTAALKVCCHIRVLLPRFGVAESTE